MVQGGSPIPQICSRASRDAVAERTPSAHARVLKLYLIALGTLLGGSGATCQRTVLVNPFAGGPVAPQVLAENATRDQIIAAVNQNSARIQSLSATGATITIPDAWGLPILSGNIAAERPGRFRFTAGTAVTGQEIDLGSNDELFWVWSRRNQPPAVYVCRHDRFPQSNIRQIMPVEPKWFLAALGMVDLDPAAVIDGPNPRGDGTVELRSWLPTQGGNLQRVTVIDARRALVKEQHVYDQAGTTLLASAIAESHRYLEPQQVALPGLVAVKLPTASMEFKIDLGTVQLNQLTGNQQQLWTLPTYEGYPRVDLGQATAGQAVPDYKYNHAAEGTVRQSLTYPQIAPRGTPLADSSANGVVQTNGLRYLPLPQYGRDPSPSWPQDASARTANSAP